MIIKSEYEVFLTIYEKRSLSKAADALDKQQGALSKILTKVEEDFGGQLFVRSNRGLVPTDAGHHLYRQIQSHILLWKDFQSIKNSSDKELSGLLRVGGHEAVLCQFTKALAQLTEAHPRLKLEFDFDRSPEVTRKVLNHQLDLALAANPQRFDDLVIRNLKRESVSLYSAQKKPKEWIIYNPDLISSASIIKGLASKAPFQLVEAKNYDFAAMLALDLKGSALLPESIAQRFQLRQQMSASFFTAKLSLVYRADHKIDRRILEVFSNVG